MNLSRSSSVLTRDSDDHILDGILSYLCVGFSFLCGIESVSATANIPAYGGVQFNSLGGYIICLFALPRLLHVLLNQRGFFWFVVSAYCLGSLIPVLDLITKDISVPTNFRGQWMRIGLFAIVYYSARTDETRRRCLLALTIGAAFVVLTYCLFLVADYNVVSRGTRVIEVMLPGEGNTINRPISHSALLFFILFFNNSQVYVRWLRGLSYLAALLFIIIVHSADQRASMIAMVVAFGFGLSLINRQRFALKHRVLSFVVVVLVGFSAIIVRANFEDDIVKETRWAFTTQESIEVSLQNIDSGRYFLYSLALEIVAENPFGIGLGNQNLGMLEKLGMSVDGDGFSCHNLYLHYLIECGWLGGLLFFMGLSLLFLTGMRRVRVANEVWPVVFIVYHMLELSFHGSFVAKTTWLVFAIIAVPITRLSVPRVEVAAAG